MMHFFLFVNVIFCATNLPILITEDWKLENHSKSMFFYSKKISCIDSVNGVFLNQLIFAIENKSSVSQQVSWNLEITDENGNILMNDLDEATLRVLLLKPHERIEGSCDHDLLSTYLSFIDKPEVTKISQVRVLIRSVLKVYE
jgi:hypothetical protein